MTEARSPGSETLRKIVHMAMGGFAFLLRYLHAWQAAAAATVALVHNVWIMPRVWGHRVYREEEVHRGLPVGIIFYPISVFILILLFPGHLFIAAGAWAIMAYGDGLAGFLGPALGRHRWPWNRAKTVEGSLAFLVGGSLGAALLVYWTVGYRVPAAWSALSGPWFFVLIPALATFLTLWIETLPLRLDDNLTVPLSAGLWLYVLYFTDWSHLAAQAPQPTWWLVAAGINLVPALLFHALGWVDRGGFWAGLVVGWLTLVLGGFPAYAVLFLFFVLGSATTRLGRSVKMQRGIAESGRRGWQNVVAKGLPPVVALYGARFALEDLRPWAMMAFVAAMTAATMDTVSGEIGKWLGRRTFLWWRWRRVPPGTEGAVSLEGTLAGWFAGAVVVAAAIALRALPNDMVWALGVLAVAWVANLLESLFGAWLQARQLATNEEVNAMLMFTAMILVMALRSMVGLHPGPP